MISDLSKNLIGKLNESLERKPIRKTNKRLNESCKPKMNEASTGTETIELNTGVLPVVDIDMYSMGEMLNSYNYDSVEDLDEIVMSVAPGYIEETVKEILPSATVQATGVYHPEYYNFSGDELEFNLIVSSEELDNLIGRCKEDSNFNAYLKEKYSSRSGFMSTMPDNIDDFNNAKRWQQAVQTIMYNVSEDKIADNNETYLDDFLDKVGSTFGYIEEEDLDESANNKKYPRKIKSSEGTVFTKVNDGTYENADIPEYRNERGNTTLIPDTDKYEVIEEEEQPMLHAKDGNTIVAKNQYNYNVLGLIIDDENKQFQIVNGQVLPNGKYKRATKKGIRSKAEELLDQGYTEYKGYGSVAL